MNLEASSSLRTLGQGTKQAIKINKLTSFARCILHSPTLTDEFNNLKIKLNLNEQQILKGFLEYNLDIFDANGNEIYESIINRVVLHIHNQIIGSWHIARQDAVERFVKECNPKKIVDIGFGVPSKYMKGLVIKGGSVKLTLCDYYESAFVFAKALLEEWDKEWSTTVNFAVTDMDKQDFVGLYDMYIFQDSIEHTLDPTGYLKKYVNLSSKDAKFLFSLPIGKLIPRHYIAWETRQEAAEWLNECGLDIEAEEMVSVNPQVDLFAEQLDFDYHNLIVQCGKK